MRCLECDQPVARTANGRWREVRGWEQVGKPGHLVVAVATGRVMHKLCMDLRQARAGVQLRLFTEDDGG